jgi:hypothetical protein
MTKTAAAPNKQVIYVDVDDEITAVIDKMNGSSAKVVAFVLPKRASVFQSVVNMKLLKRRAESAKKHIVLITSEAGLMPLAGMAGLHVAATLQSKPEIPTVADPSDADDDAEDAQSNDFDSTDNAERPVGDLAGAASAGTLAGATYAGAAGAASASEAPTSAGSPSNSGKPAKPTGPKNRKLNVPNFLRFRKRFLVLGVAIVLLIVGFYFAYFVMPKGTVTIKTNSKDVDVELALTLDTNAQTVDAEKLTVPAKTKQDQKSSMQQAPATGQANKGEIATGSVTITNCSPNGDAVTIPAGTGVASSDNKTFITQKSVTLGNSTPNCKSVDGFTSATVNVVAQSAGAAYNVAAGDFTVAGVSNVKATSSNAMSGGTDKNVKIVQQSDIDTAQQKLGTAQEQDAVKKQLQSNLEDDGLYAIPITFYAATPTTTTSSKVGDEADTVTVSQAVTYTMFGVKKTDLEKLVEAQVQKKVDNKTQTIQDYGFATARFNVETPGPGPQEKIDVTLNAVAGPKLNTDDIAKSIKGLKSGQVRDKLKSTEGVEDVEVKYSPFWVTKAPKASKITIQFEKASSTNDDNGSDDK